jgi:hypothetical protein
MLHRSSRHVAEVIAMFAILSGSCFPSESSNSADTPASSAAFPHRPRVGLVLAGGGAKGTAHVGVRTRSRLDGRQY